MRIFQAETSEGPVYVKAETLEAAQARFDQEEELAAHGAASTLMWTEPPALPKGARLLE